MYKTLIGDRPTYRWKDVVEHLQAALAEDGTGLVALACSCLPRPILDSCINGVSKKLVRYR